jgi:hypothetical protein
MPRTRTPLQRHLYELNADEVMRMWAGTRTAEQAWAQCKKADWLLWWVGHTDPQSNAELIRVGCEIVKVALDLVGDDCLQSALHAVVSWMDNPTAKEEFKMRYTAINAPYHIATAINGIAHAAAYIGTADDIARAVIDAYRGAACATEGITERARTRFEKNAVSIVRARFTCPSIEERGKD